MSKTEAKKLANLLRLLADRLEEDPDAAIAFLQGEAGQASAAPKKSETKGEVLTPVFNLIQFYQDSGKSRDALEAELKNRKVPELRNLAKQYTGSGKKGPSAKAPKKELVQYLVGVASKGTSSADIFLGA